MRIKRHLPQFHDRTALLVVAGRKAADVYIASSGKLDRVEHIKEERPAYEDNEGFSWTTAIRPTGARYRMSSGAQREPLDDHRGKKFLHELARLLWRQEQRRSVDEVYLFTPKPHELLGVLHPDLRKKVREVVKGDFAKEHPFMLLERLKRELDVRIVVPAPPSYVRRFLQRVGF